MPKQMYILDSKDIQGGDILIADGGFTCLREGEEHPVCYDEESPSDLYIKCDEGKHFLEGQLNEEDQYVGFLKKETP